MAIDGILGTVSHDDDRARGHGHDPVIVSAKIATNQGVLPVGLIVSKNGSGELVPYAVVEDEAFGTGNATLKDFTHTLASAPVEPGTVSVTAGSESFSDDGLGRLTSAAGGTGTVNYTTGVTKVSFNAAPGSGAAITADYDRMVVGVLDETVDSAKTTSATYIVHGSVRRDALKVGATAKAAPSAALLDRLAKRGIWAM